MQRKCLRAGCGMCGMCGMMYAALDVFNDGVVFVTFATRVGHELGNALCHYQRSARPQCVELQRRDTKACSNANEGCRRYLKQIDWESYIILFPVSPLKRGSGVRKHVIVVGVVHQCVSYQRGGCDQDGGAHHDDDDPHDSQAALRRRRRRFGKKRRKCGVRHPRRRGRHVDCAKCKRRSQRGGEVEQLLRNDVLEARHHRHLERHSHRAIDGNVQQPAPACDVVHVEHHAAENVRHRAEDDGIETRRLRVAKRLKARAAAEAEVERLHRYLKLDPPRAKQT